MRHIEKGAIVELPGEVDGFVPHSHMSPVSLKNYVAHFPADETLKFKVIEFDKEGKRIVLSLTEYYKDKDPALYQEFLASHKINYDDRRERKQRGVEKRPKAKQGDEPQADTPQIDIPDSPAGESPQEESTLTSDQEPQGN